MPEDREYIDLEFVIKQNCQNVELLLPMKQLLKDLEQLEEPIYDYPGRDLVLLIYQKIVEVKFSLSLITTKKELIEKAIYEWKQELEKKYFDEIYKEDKPKIYYKYYGKTMKIKEFK